jgi:hypothetical protein
MWGHIEPFVYSAPMSEFEVIQQRAENACQEFGVKPGILQGLRTSVRRRAESCAEMDENHLERLL